MKKILALFSLVWIAACAEAPDSASKLGTFDQVIVSSATGVISNIPSDGELDVSPMSKVQIIFSESIEPNSMDHFSVQVLDSGGRQVSGLLQLSNNAQLITFTRMIGNLQAALDLSTTYTVKTQFLKDREGNLVAQNQFTFTTKSFNDGSNDFQVVRAYPEEEATTNKRQKFQVQFSDPIYLSPGQAVCDNNLWSNAFTVTATDPFDDRDRQGASRRQIKGKICVVKSSTTKQMDTLEFQPLEDYPNESMLQIAVVKGAPELKSIYQETLSNGFSKEVGVGLLAKVIQNLF